MDIRPSVLLYRVIGSATVSIQYDEYMLLQPQYGPADARLMSWLRQTLAEILLLHKNPCQKFFRNAILRPPSTLSSHRIALVFPQKCSKQKTISKNSVISEANKQISRKELHASGQTPKTRELMKVYRRPDCGFSQFMNYLRTKKRCNRLDYDELNFRSP